LARALTERDPAASALVITGAPLAPGLVLPERVDTVKLPMLSRDEVGGLGARNLAMGSGELHALRAMLAEAAATAFCPDVAVIDKLPRGLAGELEPTLRALRRLGTRVVLGLRDVEEDPAVVRARWRAMDAHRALEEFYDAVLVYGPGGASDALGCVGWQNPPFAVFHVGFLGAPLPDAPPADLPADYVLATVGGGADGFETLDAVLGALEQKPLGIAVVMVGGPLMDAAQTAALRERARGLDVVFFQARADMDAVIAGARGVVAMAGYNTVAEITRAGHPAVLVPRRGPSLEQQIRAQALQAQGTFAMIAPEQLTPARMADELHALLHRPRRPFDPTQHCGAATAARILCDLAENPPTPAAAPAPLALAAV
jgi:predicted glycosyltransferase